MLSAGLDGAIKVWAPVEGVPGPGKVLEPAPMYSHPPADSGGGSRGSGSGTGEPGQILTANGAAAAAAVNSSGFGGILALGGTVDASGGALVAASHADDGQVRLWELPSFAEKGSLGGVADARALAFSPGGLVIVGDKRGVAKVWRWKTGEGEGEGWWRRGDEEGRGKNPEKTRFSPLSLSLAELLSSKLSFCFLSFRFRFCFCSYVCERRAINQKQPALEKIKMKRGKGREK